MTEPETEWSAQQSEFEERSRAIRLSKRTLTEINTSLKTIERGLRTDPNHKGLLKNQRKLIKYRDQIVRALDALYPGWGVD